MMEGETTGKGGLLYTSNTEYGKLVANFVRTPKKGGPWPPPSPRFTVPYSFLTPLTFFTGALYLGSFSPKRH